jgi:hypothetical protein
MVAWHRCDVGGAGTACPPAPSYRQTDHENLVATLSLIGALALLAAPAAFTQESSMHLTSDATVDVAQAQALIDLHFDLERARCAAPQPAFRPGLYR